MKAIGWKAAILLVIGVLVSQWVLADHRHHRGHYHGGVGIYFGGPWADYYYAYPPHYYSPVLVVPMAPPIYIEKEAVAPPPAPGFWYYCSDPQGYYPSVKECPTGWQKVAPQPPTN